MSTVTCHRCEVSLPESHMCQTRKGWECYRDTNTCDRIWREGAPERERLSMELMREQLIVLYPEYADELKEMTDLFKNVEYDPPMRATHRDGYIRMKDGGGIQLTNTTALYGKPWIPHEDMERYRKQVGQC